jgi:hypothetical protein
MVTEMREKESEQLGKAGEVKRMARRGRPLMALPRKLQQPSTKANMPVPFCGL